MRPESGEVLVIVRPEPITLCPAVTLMPVPFEMVPVAAPYAEPAPTEEYTRTFELETGEEVARPEPVMVTGEEPGTVKVEQETVPEQVAVVVAVVYRVPALAASVPVRVFFTAASCGRLVVAVMK